MCDAGWPLAMAVTTSLPFRARVRQEDRWFAFNPCRRATSFTVTPGTIVFASDGAIHIGKALSTPPAFANGVLNSIASAAGPMGLTLEDLLARTHLFSKRCSSPTFLLNL